MANANITKIGITDTVAKEEAAMAVEAPVAPAADVAPNISERRVVGKREVETPYGKIVIENL